MPTHPVQGASSTASDHPEASWVILEPSGEALRVVILVPRRRDRGHRDKLWAFCREWWERTFPWPIYEGHHDEGLFNRSAAVNKAATMAGEWDVAIVIDSDVLGNPESIHTAVTLANVDGGMVLPFELRKDLNPRGTEKVIGGFRGSWEQFIHKTYPATVSSIVVVPRRLWDAVGGFDETFEGWGFEDNAFASACTTFGGPIVRLPGEVWHLWHPGAKRERLGSRSFAVNKARAARYHEAIGDPEKLAKVRDGRIHNDSPVGIPRILHRVVPKNTTDEVERWWVEFEALHPGWEMKTWRDPLDPAEFPLTSPSWDRVKNGAQLADLVRLEVVLRYGGIYVDSDVEPYRSLEPLLPLSAFACWEDRKTIPNAVFGAAPNHPAIRMCLEFALARMDLGTWEAGPWVTTEVLAFRDDVLTLPPGSFYPYHYTEKKTKRNADHMMEQPWSFAAHHWAGSWLPKEKRW